MHPLPLLLSTIFFLTSLTFAISIPRVHPYPSTTSPASTATLSPCQEARLASILALTPLASSELSAGAATKTVQPSAVRSGAMIVHIAGKVDFEDRRFDEGAKWRLNQQRQLRVIAREAGW